VKPSNLQQSTASVERLVAVIVLVVVVVVVVVVVITAIKRKIRIIIGLPRL